MYRQLIKERVEKDDLNTFVRATKTNPVNIYNYRFCKAKIKNV
jgi:hypothetical protein